MSTHTALIVGATGLVGKHLLDHMLTKTYYSKIKILSRRALEIDDPRVEVIVIPDFAEMNSISEQLQAEDYYCVLGTTIKLAGSKENFKKVDLDYPLMLAEIAQKSPEFRQYLVVTAAGSNADSPLFYNQVKGQLEEGLKQLHLRGLKIFRPSLLLGERRDFRLAEEFAKAISKIFSFFMVGLKRRLWSINASDVAKAMHIVASEGKEGIRVYSSNDMFKIVNTQGL